MTIREFDVPAGPVVLKGTAWLPEKAIANVLIEHGMAEHHKRYEDFASSLVARGIGVYSYDKRGHGLTAGKPGSEDWKRNSGWFAHDDGWNVLVEDSLAVLAYIRKDGNVPLFLMGHSMGSFLVRTVAADPRSLRYNLAGLIISGTSGSQGALGAVGYLIASLLTALQGPYAPSPFLDTLSSGTYASLATGEKKPRTKFDWLSRDGAEVDKYIADPYCGFLCTTSFFRDMVGGINRLFTAGYAKRFPRDLPVLLYSGDCDPVGGMGKGVTSVSGTYKKWGVKDLTFKLFPGGRHEMHNETNRQEVYALIQNWITERIGKVK
jgi:alpha-beta hydrolase superfamily lysophospholipase